jgi:hypothetical protein
MGVITPDRFDPIKAFCNVRLQQGVPLVDADVNELDDVRAYEVRAFLKWFVGNGVPDGNDGFRIAPLASASTSDFQILAGAQLPAAGPAPPPTVDGTLPAPNQVGSNARAALVKEFALQACGRCIVDGLDVIISADTTFTGQALHNSQAGAAALAASWGVPTIGSVPVLAATGPIVVYLDVWERPVAPGEDGTLVVPPLGVESCARIKREWVVRTLAGTTAPATATLNGIVHVYYGLAIISQRVLGGAVQNIAASDIADQREQRLVLPPSTLIYDVLGTQASPSTSATALAYRQGLNRPAMTLRDAINALLRGEVPATPEAPVTSDPNNDIMSYAFNFDANGGVNAVWTSNRNLATDQVFAARWDPGAPAAGFTGLSVITSSASQHLAPSSALLPNGDVLAAYSTSPLSPASVLFKHASTFASMTPTAPAETPVVSTGTPAQRAPFVIATGSAAGGGTVVFFWHESTIATSRWVYQRRAYEPTWDEPSARWTDAAGQPLSSTVISAQASPSPSPPTSSGDFHAAADSLGNIWTAFRTGPAPTASSIQVAQLTIATNALTSPPALHVGATTTDQAPFVLVDVANSLVWVFWQSDQGIYAQQYQSGSGAAILTPVLIADTTIGSHANPCAVMDATGAVWLFWESDRGGLGSRIWFNRRGALTGWGVARQVTGSTFADSQPYAVIGPNGNIWLFWRRVISGTNGDLYFKQIMTAI